jgi:NADPH-dependent 2,4-dienoyl-CoA reductase/sulfur reductase-like enzyme
MVHTCRDNTQQSSPFDALVLCTGATDRLLPIRGWQLAGTYSLGGAQVALKSQACAIGGRVVFMGTGPLLYLVAAQYLKAGANVAAVLDTSAATRRLAALPQLLALPDVLWHGLMLIRALRRGGVACHDGVTPLAINGDAQRGVASVSFRDALGRETAIACDAVAMGYHLRPETQLADLARCEFEYHDDTHQWQVITDAEGRSTSDGVYLAGDGADILGARAAEVAGRLVACTVLQDLGLPQAQSEVARLQNAMTRYRRFADGLRRAFPWPAHLATQLRDETIVCRCESISVGELRTAARQAGAFEANRAKAFSRVGMGRCQGRYCGSAAAEIIAQTCEVTVQQAGRLRGQAPVKPLPMSLGAASGRVDQTVSQSVEIAAPDA